MGDKVSSFQRERGVFRGPYVPTYPTHTDRESNTCIRVKEESAHAATERLFAGELWKVYWSVGGGYIAVKLWSFP